MNDNTRDIRIEQFDYSLPDDRIARHPWPERDQCKLLVRHSDGRLTDTMFDQIGRYLPENSRLVMNDTRVINARVRMRKGDNNDGALIEIFCLEPDSPRDYAQNFASTGAVEWKCFVGNSKRWKSDTTLSVALTVKEVETILRANRVAVEGNTSTVRFEWDNSSATFADIIDAVGEIPIPPYLNRDTEPTDLTDYQTVYSTVDGSVAAPTAGLHFTKSLLERLARQGHQSDKVTLHVGAGTFQPVKTESIGDHTMHAEFISVSRDLIDSLISDRRPVTAIGTTSVRTLESLYHIGCMIYQGKWQDELPQWYPYSPDHPQLTTVQALEYIRQYLADRGVDTLVATTRIIIAPGYRYRLVDAMVTNFHQPRSTLLLLVSAFVNDDWRPIYEHALNEPDYRFLSYGDACLLLR